MRASWPCWGKKQAESFQVLSTQNGHFLQELNIPSIWPAVHQPTCLNASHLYKIHSWETCPLIKNPIGTAVFGAVLFKTCAISLIVNFLKFVTAISFEALIYPDSALNDVQYSFYNLFLQSFYNLFWERPKKKLQDCVQGIRCLSYRDCYLSNKTWKSSNSQSMTTRTCTKHSHGRTEAQTQIFVSWRVIVIDTWGGKPGLGPGLPCCGGCPGCPGGWPGWCPGSPGYRCCPG